MKTLPLIGAAAIVMVANLAAVLHGVRNRATQEAEVTLTQRELRYFDYAADDDDSGVTLHLQRADSELPPWLDQQKLQKLGFDCSVSPSSSEAARYYQRQRSRQAFVALEYDGPAWRSWAENHDRETAKQRSLIPGSFPDTASLFSHLVAVDVDLDPVHLRARHPDRTAVLIVPAAVSIMLQPFSYPGMTLDTAAPPRLAGRIEEIPSTIDVPRPFSDEFRRRRTLLGRLRQDTAYRVRLRYGSSWEPWVAGMELLN